MFFFAELSACFKKVVFRLGLVIIIMSNLFFGSLVFTSPWIMVYSVDLILFSFWFSFAYFVHSRLISMEVMCLGLASFLIMIG